jgi:hypothetical protein
MSTFHSNWLAYEASDDPLYQSELVPLSAIEPVVRGLGVANFDGSRAMAILKAIQAQEPLPPIRVRVATSLCAPYQFKLHDGFHRFHLSLALGFTHISVAVMSDPDADAI